MATTQSFLRVQYEQTPRYQSAPTVSPYLVSTASRDMAIQSGRITPGPQMIDRADELRGIEGAPPQLVNLYAPAGDITIRAYVNDLIFLLGLAGFVATVTAGAATLDQWTVAQGGTWTGGTFTLTYNTQTTGPIPYNATAAQVQAALQALSNIPAGSVICSGGPLPATPVTVTFTGSLAGISQTITATATGLTGTAPTVTLTHAAVGAAGGSAALPDGGFPPTGTNVWQFAKRSGITAKTAQILACYANDGVFLQGQGYGVSQIGGNSEGAITASLLGLVVQRVNDPNLTPAFDTSVIPHLRRGDMSITWLTGTGVANDFTWQCANPLEPLSSLGVQSYYPDTMEQGPGRVMVTGTIPKRTLASADIDALLAAGTFAATATWHSTKAIAATNYPYSMFLQMPSCQIIGGDPDPLTNLRHFGASFNWTAAWDETNGYDARFTLVSSLAATSVASAGVGL